MTTILLDANVYDKLQFDTEACSILRALVECGRARVIATPAVLGELQRSPFGGPPNWFPIAVETESVTVIGDARLGRTRLGAGQVYKDHRGESRKVPDAIIADSADALADILVSEDRRCRKTSERG